MHKVSGIPAYLSTYIASSSRKKCADQTLYITWYEIARVVWLVAGWNPVEYF